MNAVKSSLSGEWRVVSMLDQISIIDEASKYRYWTSIHGPSFNLHPLSLWLITSCGIAFYLPLWFPHLRSKYTEWLKKGPKYKISQFFCWKIKRYPPYTTPWIISKKSTNLVRDLVHKPWYLTAIYLGDRQVSCSQSTKTDVRNVINKVTSMQDDPEKIVEAIEKGFQKHK